MIFGALGCGAGEAAHLEVLDDRQPREDAPPFGRVADARCGPARGPASCEMSSPSNVTVPRADGAGR